MRTTVTLDADSEQVIAALRRSTGMGLSEAINELIRRGSHSPEADYAFPSFTVELGARVSIDRTSELLDLLGEEDGSR